MVIIFEWASFFFSSIYNKIFNSLHLKTKYFFDLQYILFFIDTGNVTECDPGIIHTAVTYLLPFTLEHSLIAVATFMTMFMTLDIRVNGEVLNSIKRSVQ